MVTREPAGESSCLSRYSRRRPASQTPAQSTPPASITSGVVGEVVVGRSTERGCVEAARGSETEGWVAPPVEPRDVTRAESISTEPFLRRRSLTTREIQTPSVRGGLHDRKRQRQGARRPRRRRARGGRGGQLSRVICSSSCSSDSRSSSSIVRSNAISKILRANNLSFLPLSPLFFTTLEG